ncbi:MAG: hypothetical protein AVO33_00345 [delta proteobacterium ML8_F1]|nr:MAG: hypothetical protein AVO33_00345 [delta proteobacterium ML8_F1]
MNLLKGLLDYTRLVFHRWYPKKRIEAYQLKELKKLYRYAIAHSPFYRDLYRDAPFNSISDFYKLPVIDKKRMMDHFTELNTCGLVKEEVSDFALRRETEKAYLQYYKDRYVVGLSSGTSGNKGLFITERELTERLPFVFLARSGIPLRLLPFKILFMLRVFNQGFNDINADFISLSYLSTMEPVDRVIQTINALGINILMAPPSMINRLLPEVRRITADIRLVVTYAEVLSPVEKDRFKEVFKTEVIEIYQASEGQMASACRLGHLHINEDLVFVELYDAEGCLIGEPGVVGHRMIITNLVNYAQPLIRYEMNDMIVLDEPCPCGSKFRRIKQVLGRHDDILYFRRGDEIQYVFPDLFVRWIIVTSDDIREFKVIQHRLNEITVDLDLLVPNAGIPDLLKAKLLRELAAYGIQNPEISINLKRIELPREKNKFKRFESHLPKD